MKKIITLTIIILLPIILFADKVTIKGLNPGDLVDIKSFDNATTYASNLNTIPLVWDYGAIGGLSVGDKVRIRKKMPSGEYIERVYELKAGDDNVLYMVTLGFFETDRKELDSIAVKAARMLERKEGSVNEIKSWVIKAVKDLQRIP